MHTPQLFMSNKMERFTKCSRNLLFRSREVAGELGHSTISLEDVLLAMTSFSECGAYLALNDYDIIEAKLLPLLNTKTVSLPQHPLYGKNQDLSTDVKKVLELSVSVARDNDYFYIASGHMLIALMKVDSEIIDEILIHFNVQKKDIIKRATYYLGESSVERLERLSQQPKHDSAGCQHISGDIFKRFFGFMRNSESDDEKK